MITLSFLKLLQDNSLGVIDQDLFFQKLTLDKYGVYISDVGDPIARGSRTTQSFELYARGKTDVEGYQKLEAILDFMKQIYSTGCTLPPVPPISSKEYKNVTIKPLSTITNMGLDAKNRTIYVVQGQITL